MAIQLVTQAVNKEFDKAKVLDGEKQLPSFLFPIVKGSTAAGVNMQALTVNGFAVASHTRDGRSQVVTYNPGSEEQYVPEVGGRMTPITPSMRDQAIVGLPADSPQKAIALERAAQIMEEHKVGFKMTKIHQALEVYLSGTETYIDEVGDAVHVVDFARSSSLTDVAVDFTSVAMDAALKTGIDLLEAQSADMDGLYAIMGSSWLTEYQTDSIVKAKMLNNAQNVLVESQRVIKEVEGIKGLRFIGRYQPDGTSVWIDILAYSPGTKYYATNGAGGADFMPAAKMIMASRNTKAYTFNRGFEVYNDDGKLITVYGDMAFDSVTDKMARTEFICSHHRVLYAVSNINHTLSMEGTFA